MEELLLSIDSLNVAYGIEQQEFRSFRKWLRGALTETVADDVGAVVGNWIGKQLGASVGVASANPLLAVGGYIVGGKMGGVVGCAAASYAAYLITQKAESVTYENSASNMSATVDPNELSYGELHNVLIDKVRVRVNEHLQINPDGSVDVQRIYNDMLRAEKELGIVDPVSASSYYKNEMIRDTVSLR